MLQVQSLDCRMWFGSEFRVLFCLFRTSGLGDNRQIIAVLSCLAPVQSQAVTSTNSALIVAVKGSPYCLTPKNPVRIIQDPG